MGPPRMDGEQEGVAHHVALTRIPERVTHREREREREGVAVAVLTPYLISAFEENLARPLSD